MAFDPDKYLAQKEAPAKDFDPDKYLASKEGPQDKTGAGEAALQGYGQALSSGYLNNLQAAAEPLTDKLFSALTGKDVSDPKDYEQRKLDNIKRDETLKEEHPFATAAGNVGGAINQGMLFGGAGKALGLGGEALETASAAKKLGIASGSGGLQGLIQNPGETDSLKDNLTERIKNAGLGIATGGVTEGAALGLQAGANKLAKPLESLTNEAALETVNPRMGQFKKFFAMKDHGEHYGQFLRDEGLAKPGASVHDVAEGLDDIVQDSGKKIQESYANVQNKMSDLQFLKDLPDKDFDKLVTNSPINGNKMADDLVTKITDKYGGSGNEKKILGTMQDQLQALKEAGDTGDIKTILKIRQAFDDNASAAYNPLAKSVSPAEKANRDAANYVRDQTKKYFQNLDDVIGTKETKTLLENNKKFHTALDLKSMADVGSARMAAKVLPGLIEKGVGGGVGLGEYAYAQQQGDEHAAEKGIGAGLSATLLHTLGRKYGPGLATGLLGGAAKATRATSMGLQSLLNNPAAIGSGSQNLSNQNQVTIQSLLGQ